MERARLNAKPAAAKPLKKPVLNDRFISSGSHLFDRALGGGWGQGRIVNIVGDRSTGKTGLVVEAFANLARMTDANHCRYGEAENAFDDDYARILGMPKGVQRPKDPLETVEDFYKDLDAFLEKQNGRDPCMYALDSLDALSDDAEMKAEIDKDSYGAAKAKKMSQLFRRLVSPIAEANCTLIVVSQMRDKIGAMFGEKHTRSGGKALDFYASQIVWLTELGKIYQTYHHSKRSIGIEVKARVKKNKMGMAHREALMQILFNYGIDDEISMIEWLKDVRADYRLKEGRFLMDSTKLIKTIHEARKNGDRDLLADVNEELRSLVDQEWSEIENALKPPMRKYA